MAEHKFYYSYISYASGVFKMKHKRFFAGVLVVGLALFITYSPFTHYLFSGSSPAGIVLIAGVSLLAYGTAAVAALLTSSR
jgi:hypothetical protein